MKTERKRKLRDIKPLTHRIKAKGYSMMGFSSTLMGIPYGKFNYKMKTGSFELEEFDKLCTLLNCSLKDLYQPVAPEGLGNE